MSTYVWKRSEPGLWTVGYYDPAGKWQPDSDHGSEEEAAQRVNRLNGGKAGTAWRIAEGLVVHPGDTLVLRLDQNGVDPDEVQEAKAAIESGMPPGVRVGVIVADGQLAVVRAAQPDPRPLAPLPTSQPIGARLAPTATASDEAPR